MDFRFRRHQKLAFGNHPLPMESLQMAQEREESLSGIYIHGRHSFKVLDPASSPQTLQ